VLIPRGYAGGMTTMKNDAPLITVVGALSKQGRSVAQTLLSSGRFRVRALTRRVDAPEAQHLASLGAELMRVPLAPGHKRELVHAFRGAHGAFLMTPVVVPPDTHEPALGREQADAAIEAGVQHIVFSSLEHVERITNGTKHARYFTDKAEIEDYIRTLPVRSSFVLLALFYTNLIEFYPPRMEGATLVFPFYLPADCSAPFVDPLTATGPAVLEIFSNPGEYAGQSLPVIGDIITPREMVETFTRVTGRKAEYRPAYAREAFLRSFPQFAGNEAQVREILGMVEYIVEYGYYRRDRDLLWSRRVDPGTLTWERFLRATRWDGQQRSFAA
jgi:hypothetical protein